MNSDDYKLHFDVAGCAHAGLMGEDPKREPHLQPQAQPAVMQPHRRGEQGTGLSGPGHEAEGSKKFLL